MGGGACEAIFLDLSKAFDTVEYDVLLKLRHLGFEHSVMSWFKSYLSNHHHSTRVNGTLSDSLQMNSGVPRGSILGPLLFICYINDLPNCLNKSSAYIYADDTALLVHGKDSEELEHLLSDEFSIICRWFNANKLSVIEKKTRVMLFCNSRSKHSGGQLKIPTAENSDEYLEQVQNTKYFGIELDGHLTFANHIDNLCCKVKSRAGILWHMCGTLSEELAKDLYMSLIHPHFMYSDVIYDACNQ